MCVWGGWERGAERLEGRSALFCISSLLLLSSALLLMSGQEKKWGSGYLMWLPTRKMVIPSLSDAAASLVNPVRFSMLSKLERIQVLAPSLLKVLGVPPCCPVPWGISCIYLTSSTRGPVSSLSWRGQCGWLWCPFLHLDRLSTAPSPFPRTLSTLPVQERSEVRQSPVSNLGEGEGWASLNFISNSLECSSLDFERKKCLHLLYCSENGVKRGNRVTLWIFYFTKS